MRFSALTGLQCNHATCLGKQAYHAGGMMALRRLHRLRLKNMHCQSAHNTKHKTQNTTHSCRVFSEKTGVCGLLNLERKRGFSELQKAKSTAARQVGRRYRYLIAPS